MSNSKTNRLQVKLKTIFAILLSFAMVIGVFAGAIPTVSASTVEEELVASDDFNRANSAVGEIGNNWVVNNSDKFDKATITSNQLVVSAKSSVSWRKDNIARPDSEARLNQKISADFVGQWWNSAFFTLRADKESDGAYSGYALELKAKYAYIRAYSADGTGVIIAEGGWNDTIDTASSKTNNAHIEFSVVGSNPTVIEANIYSLKKNANKKTLLARFYVTDSTADLQDAGTVAIADDTNGGANYNQFTVDNFKYTSPIAPITDETVFYDNFDRANTTNLTLDNGWTAKNTSNYVTQQVNAGKLKLTGKKALNRTTDIIVRPASEARLNQKVETDVIGAWWSDTYLYLRVNDAETGVNAYVLQFKNTSLTIYKLVNGTLTQLKQVTELGLLTANEGCRIEFSAIGSNSTELKASVIVDEVSNGFTTGKEKILKTITCIDNDAALQTAGTVGVANNSAADNTWNYIFFDNFHYTSPADVVVPDGGFYDNFRRANTANGTVDNDWVIAGADKFTAVNLADYRLKLQGGEGSNYRNNYVARPDSEAGVNQKVDFFFDGTWFLRSYVSLRQSTVADAGIQAYTLQIAQKGVSILRVNSDGTAEELKYFPYGAEKGTLKARIEFSAIGTYPTVLQVKVYETDIITNKETLIVDGSCVDYSDERIEAAGTAAFSIDHNVNSYELAYIDDILYTKPLDVIGDFNADKTVNIIDLIRFKKYLVDSENVEAYGFKDLDGNGEVQAGDLVSLRKILLK